MRYLLYPFTFSSLVACTAPQPSVDTETPVQEVSFVRDELSVQHGQSLFVEHCAACHNFEETGIGPNLSGATARADKDWLTSFISNAPRMIDSGDERAVQLYEQYNQYMPAFPQLSEEDIEHLLGFIHKYAEGEKKNRNNRPSGLIDPVPEKIAQSPITLVLEEVLTVPPSADHPPLARINKLLAIETSQDERLFVHDLRGTLYEIENDRPQVYLNLADEQSHFIDRPGLGSGFGSFAFHPDFEQNGLLYTTHTEPPGTAPADFAYPDSIKVTLQWVLTEWKVNDPLAPTFSGTHRELLRVNMVTGIHGFQELTFNPLPKPGQADYSMLYLGIGDGAAALRGYSFLCNSPTNVWGTVLRIDPTGNNSSNGQYGIPADNPFVDDPDARGEVWAYGFRNPHRISWDRSRSNKVGSAKMFISNIGQHSVEEVNLGVAGGNYGWPEREGTFLFDMLANPELVYPLPENDSGYVYPVVQYDHTEGNAVSGGFVYAGEQIPLLRGKYVFGDIPRGRLFYAEVADMQMGKQAPLYELSVAVQGQKTDLETLTQNQRVDLRLGTDSSGELYIFTKSNGKIYRVVAAQDTAVASGSAYSFKH